MLLGGAIFLCVVYHGCIVHKEGFKKDSDYKKHIITMVKPLNDKIHISEWKGSPLGFVSEDVI